MAGGTECDTRSGEELRLRLIPPPLPSGVCEFGVAELSIFTFVACNTVVLRHEGLLKRYLEAGASFAPDCGERRIQRADVIMHSGRPEQGPRGSGAICDLWHGREEVFAKRAGRSEGEVEEKPHSLRQGGERGGRCEGTTRGRPQVNLAQDTIGCAPDVPELDLPRSRRTP